MHAWFALRRFPGGSLNLAQMQTTHPFRCLSAQPPKGKAAIETRLGLAPRKRARRLTLPASRQAGLPISIWQREADGVRGGGCICTKRPSRIATAVSPSIYQARQARQAGRQGSQGRAAAAAAGLMKPCGLRFDAAALPCLAASMLLVSPPHLSAASPPLPLPLILPTLMHCRSSQVKRMASSIFFIFYLFISFLEIGRPRHQLR
ncbi:hypothetical protein IWX90DRAFT_162562 [Phyllosticta citrichinensis]|uniref:Uncharacterized protein n=1 Tax=Phyllosticta citrichinensis TaxID=1130410 RepID=A0ABR1Y0E1_9PEZI